MSAFDDYLKAPSQAAKPSFDSYLGVPQAPVAAPVNNGMTTVDGQPWQPPNSVGMGVGDAVGGTVQGIVHGINWLANKVAPTSDFAKESAQGTKDIDATIQAQNRAYETARAANQPTTLSGLITGQKEPPGIDWGRLGGNVIGTLPALALAPETAPTSMMGRMLLGGLQGAVGAGMMPTTDPGQDYADQKLAQLGTGAAFGAAVPGVYDASVGLGKGLWNAAKPVLQPTKFVGQGLANVMDPAEAASAAGNIRSAPQYVPGSLPTTAQVGQSPVLVQTEKAAANIPSLKGLFAQRDIDNNAARLAMLSGVAQTPSDLAQALIARRAAAQPSIDSLLTNGAHVDASPILSQIDSTLNGPLGTDPAINNALRDLKNGIASRTSGANMIAPDVLDGFRQNANSFIAKHTPNGVVGSRQNVAMNPIRDAITDSIEAANPGYKGYLSDYAKNSVPINTMQAGQSIIDALGAKPLNAGGDVNVTLAGFQGAKNRALKAATYGVDPQAQAALDAVGNDLQRATVSNSIRSPGSDTAYNIGANGWLARQLYGPGFEGATGLGKGMALVGATLAGHPIAGLGAAAGASKLGQAVGARLQGRLANLLLDPNAVLPYLDARAAAASQPVPNALVQRLLQYGRPALVNGLSSSQVNTAQ